MMTEVERTKNVLFEIRNAHLIAKFHDSLNFSLDESDICILDLAESGSDVMKGFIIMM
jgi:hypothetical protein